MNSNIIPEMSLNSVDLDDDVVFAGKSNRNFFCHKLYKHLPAGSFNIVCDGKQGEIVIRYRTGIEYLTVGTSWKHLKRMLGKEALDPKEWECPICCEKPENQVTSTCDECLNTVCMKCFILSFETTGGTIQCPWCRHILCKDKYTERELAFACYTMRKENGITHPAWFYA